MSLRLELDKELERKFRELAMHKYGFSKGALKKAAESAIEKWTKGEKIKPAEKTRNGLGVLKKLRGKIKISNKESLLKEIYEKRYEKRGI